MCNFFCIQLCLQLNLFAYVSSIEGPLKSSSLSFHNVKTDNVMNGNLNPANHKITSEDWPVDSNKISSHGRHFFTGKGWPKGIVYFEIVADDSKDRKAIFSAMETIQKNTCIKFVKKGHDNFKNYVEIKRGPAESDVGFHGIKHITYVGKNPCKKSRQIFHELFHTLGFEHEHSRPDRDKYVTILYDNIAAGNFDDFKQTSPHKFDTFGIPYDYNSILHYKSHAFSKNGHPTIVTKDPAWQNKIGKGCIPSILDYHRVNLAYKCKTGFTIKQVKE